jgi:hypothetical protein
MALLMAIVSAITHFPEFGAPLDHKPQKVKQRMK